VLRGLDKRSIAKERIHDGLLTNTIDEAVQRKEAVRMCGKGEEMVWKN